MPVNTVLAQLSNGFLVAALVTYSLAVLAYAGDFAYGRGRARTPAASARLPELTPVGAPDGRGAASADPDPAVAGDGGRALTFALASPPRPAEVGAWVRAALALTATGLALHVAGVLARGLAVHRLPWGTCTSTSRR